MSLTVSAERCSRRRWLALSLAGVCCGPQLETCASAGEPPALRQSRDKAPRWRLLPAPPALPTPSRTGVAKVNGTDIHYAQFGSGPHLLMLHGGMASSTCWGFQLGELAKRFTVTVMDTRGHGRSPYDGERLGYPLFVSDTLRLLDVLSIGEAGLIGWSDGAITAILTAIAAPARISHLVAFAANVSRSGLIPGGSKSATFQAFTVRCAAEYRMLSPRPDQWSQLSSALARMWREQPEISPDQLHRISSRTLVMDGRHDEIIRADHAAYIASRIKESRIWIQPDASHFAMLQAPNAFNDALISFLTT